MRKLSCFALLVCGLSCAGCAGTLPQTHRTTLSAATVIQGYPCAQGYAWFYTDGSLSQCSLSRETAFGEALAPAKSLIHLHPDGKPKHLMLSHDSIVAGVRCSGGSWLGPGEGSTTALYPSGKLKQCFLAGDQIVQGVPCMNGGFFGDGRGGGVQFHENGKLQSCKLTKDFASLQRGDRFVQAP
jgi:hypothetical protein